MLAGDGELFAGPAPAQAEIPVRERITMSRPESRGGDVEVDAVRIGDTVTIKNGIGYSTVERNPDGTCTVDSGMELGMSPEEAVEKKAQRRRLSEQVAQDQRRAADQVSAAGNDPVRVALTKMANGTHPERETDTGTALESVEELSDADLTPAGFSAGRRVDDAANAMLRAEEARENGEDDADTLRDSVRSIIGSSGIRVAYSRGQDGLRGLVKPSYITALEDQQQRRGKGRTTGLFIPAKDTIEGRDLVVLFTDVVTTPELAAFTAAHEIAGHHGLRAMLGDRLDKVLDLAVQNPTVQAVADSMTRQHNLRPNQRYLAIEEALADLAAAKRTGNWQRITEKHGVQVPKAMQSRLVAMLQNIVQRIKALFGKRGAAFSDAQVLSLLENAWQAAQGDSAGTIASPEALLAELKSSPVGRSLVALEKAGVLDIIHDPKQRFAGKWDGRKATLNAAQIPAGKGIGVALHELGVHAERDSLSGILGDAGFTALLATIDRWADSADPATRELAAKVQRRVNNANTQAQHRDEERLAYAVELAANAGMESGGEIRAFLRRFAAYVKAWLSASKLGAVLRARGLNFDLTPQDMAQLAAYAVARQARAVAPSRAMQAAEAFSRPPAGFAEQVRERLASGDKRGPSLEMGKTPAVLRMLGFPDLPLRMPGGVLLKLATGKDGSRAPLTERQIARLPELLDEPVAIFENGSDGGVLALTTLVDSAGNPVIVAVRPNVMEDRPAIAVNLVPTAFGKDGASRWLREQVDAGRLLYRGDEKNPRVPGETIADSDVRAGAEGAKRTVLASADLRNYRAEQRAKRLDGRFSIAPQSETGVEFTNGQETLASRLAQWAAALHLRGGSPRAIEASPETVGAVTRNAGGAAEQGDASRTEIREQSARLIERAKAEGFYWPDDSPILAELGKLPTLAGAEHQVFVVGEGNNRLVIRATDNGFFGHRSDISPAQYLARLDDYSRTFPSLQTRLIGVSESTDVEGHAVIWTAQTFVYGKKFKTQALLAEAMAGRGWQEDGYPGVPRFKHESGAIIEDAHTDNVFQDDNGDLYPFDVVVEALPNVRYSMPDSEPGFTLTGIPEKRKSRVVEAFKRARQRRNEVNAALGNPATGGTLGYNADKSEWVGTRGAMRQARESLQDRMILLRDVQQDIEAARGEVLPDEQNVYRMENLMYGRVGKSMETLDDVLFDPLFKAMRKAKVTPETLEEYLYARHAKERNADLRETNPDIEAGSGMTDDEADAILARATPALESLGAMVDRITRDTRKRLYSHGMVIPPLLADCKSGAKRQAPVSASA